MMHNATRLARQGTHFALKGGVEVDPETDLTLPERGI